jgi:hypothetical protein
MSIESQLRQWQLEQEGQSLDREREAKLAAESERREFVSRMNHFVGIWNKIVSEYNKQGSLNIKNARALTKAFRRIQATGWPK